MIIPVILLYDSCPEYVFIKVYFDKTRLLDFSHEQFGPAVLTLLGRTGLESIIRPYAGAWAVDKTLFVAMLNLTADFKVKRIILF